MATNITDDAQRRAIIERMTKAKASRGSNFIKPGRYVLGIENLLLQNARKGGAMFVAEFYVEQAEGFNDVFKNGQLVLPNSPGSRVGWVLKLDELDAAMSDMKKFFMAMVGVTDEEKVSESDLFQVAYLLTGPDQKARGYLMRDDTYQYVTKSKGQEITLNQWTEIKEAPEVVAQRAAAYTVRLGAMPANTPSPGTGATATATA